MDYDIAIVDEFSSSNETNSNNFLTNPFVITEICIAILSSIENLIVLIVLCRNKSLRGRIYYFIASLSFVDFLIGSVAIPSGILVSFIIF